MKEVPFHYILREFVLIAADKGGVDLEVVVCRGLMASILVGCPGHVNCFLWSTVMKLVHLHSFLMMKFSHDNIVSSSSVRWGTSYHAHYNRAHFAGHYLRMRIRTGPVAFLLRMRDFTTLPFAF